MRKLEQEGLVIIKSFEEFGGGCIEYRVEDLFSGNTFTHTEYPPHWSVEKIAQETRSSFDLLVSKKDCSKGLADIASLDEGFNLKIVVDVKTNELSDKTLKITTAHPVLIKNKAKA